MELMLEDKKKALHESNVRDKQNLEYAREEQRLLKFKEAKEVKEHQRLSKYEREKQQNEDLIKKFSQRVAIKEEQRESKISQQKDNIRKQQDFRNEKLHVMKDFQDKTRNQEDLIAELEK